MFGDPDIQIVEDENRRSWTSPCNNCGKTIWWSKWVRNKRTKRCMPLNSEYTPDIGQNPTRHSCMKGGVKQWINKYDGSAQTELKKTWCEFCNHRFDLSHWYIFNNKKDKVSRPLLMCMKEVEQCNHKDYFEPLTEGWFRK